ncbi:MAG: hypothetical protein ABIS50_11540 [Luteolibacter sp.]|uniref:hypothetical protein n=1 Tax=Luteolibacter sp. TaxID=1962973 RepID=UPI0032672B2D
MHDLDKPEDVATVRALLAEVDAVELAAKANAISGGSQTPDGAVKVAEMTVMAALRSPGSRILVAGFCAFANGGKVTLYFAEEIAAQEIQTGEAL